MTHSHKVTLAMAVSLVLAATAAYLLLDMDWFRQLLPIDISPGVTTFGVFALFTIFLFDLMVLMLEQPSSG